MKQVSFLCMFFFVLLLLPSHDADAQWRGGRDRGYGIPERDIFPDHTFTFCRIIYTSHGGWGRRGGRAWTDYPDSDLNFSQRLSELTTINVNRDENNRIKHAVVTLQEETLFNYPFSYMIEVGDLYFSEQDAERLRDYLLRGGFLLVDDFWGEQEWNNWEYEFSKVLDPNEYPMIDIPLDHDIFNIVFELNEVPQIPGIGYWSGSGGRTNENHSGPVRLRGVWDSNGRLMVVVNHNSDLGDGWEEEARNPQYFAEFSAKKAYPLGINIIVYAMTH